MPCSVGMASLSISLLRRAIGFKTSCPKAHFDIDSFLHRTCPYSDAVYFRNILSTCVCGTCICAYKIVYYFQIIQLV
jgi:hypothetical protein